MEGGQASGEGAPHELSFSRDGFRVCQRCGEGQMDVHNGLAMMTGSGDDNYVDSYYLLPMAVYNPADFREMSETTIQISDESSDGPRMVEVYRVRSAGEELYFDRKDGRLRRVRQLDAKSGRAYVSVDLLGEIKINAQLSLPSRVRVEILASDKYAVPRKLPRISELRIDPASVSAVMEGQ
jgi:hypothetical protein